jgi:hypothetical protein
MIPVSDEKAPMAVPSPEWLTERGAELRPSKDGKSYTVYFGGEPQYLVIPVPAEGRHACRVSQTINGKRLDGAATYATFDEAVRGGLEDLRKALGW